MVVIFLVSCITRRMRSSISRLPPQPTGKFLSVCSPRMLFCFILISLSLQNSLKSNFAWTNNAILKRSFGSSPPKSLLLTSLRQEEQETVGKTNKIIVVGAGVGGLAIASRIATSSQYEVVVLEKNSEAGGRCGSKYETVPNIGTFRHERGPSLLLLPNIYRELFQDCGNSTPEDHGLTITQCVPAYKVVFSDGDTIDMGFPARSNSTNDEESSRQKLNEIEPNGAQRWDEYMAAMSAFLNCGLPNFIQEQVQLTSLPAFAYQALRNGGKFWPLRPHSDSLDAIFTSTKLKALASFQDLYVGLEPYRNDKDLFGGVIKKTAPTVFGLLSALELHPTNELAGVFAPMGGFQSVSDALTRLAESHGVKILYNCTVTTVCSNGVYYTTNNQSASVATWNPADLIVVNADLPYATKSLLMKKEDDDCNNNIVYDWDDNFDYSSGVIAYHWCVNKKLTVLNTHNVFLCSDNQTMATQSWAALRTNQSSNQQQVAVERHRLDINNTDSNNTPFNFYVHRPCKSDPSAAPDGCDSITILVPCQTLTRIIDVARLGKDVSMKVYREQFTDELIDSIRSTLFKRLSVLKGVGDLKDAILHETVDTPATYADLYNVAAGTPFGLSHGFGQLSVTRPSAEVKWLDNVLMVGASSRPGNGVPLVLIGAKLVWEKVKKKLLHS